jgi:hypothetical protein
MTGGYAFDSMAFTASGMLNGAVMGLLSKIRKQFPEFHEDRLGSGDVRGTPCDQAFMRDSSPPDFRLAWRALGA